jgi:hypothetical protein
LFGIVPGYNVELWDLENVSKGLTFSLLSAANAAYSGLFTYTALPALCRNWTALGVGAVINGALTALWVDAIYGKH